MNAFRSASLLALTVSILLPTASYAENHEGSYVAGMAVLPFERDGEAKVSGQDNAEVEYMTGWGLSGSGKKSSMGSILREFGGQAQVLCQQLGHGRERILRAHAQHQLALGPGLIQPYAMQGQRAHVNAGAAFGKNANAQARSDHQA